MYQNELLRKEAFLEQKAEYFKGVARMRRLTACVHLEGDTDKDFWEKVFKKNYPEGKFFFLSYSKNRENRKISGVAHCLKYIPYLDRNFFICIDSDYRYLEEERDINIDNYIFQTYTYSIENHYCYANFLNSVCEKSSGRKNDIFDFKKFFKTYSNIIYELFIWHLFLEKRKMSGINKLKFNETLSNFPKLSLENNGELMLRNLKERVRLKINKLRKQYPNVEIKNHFAYYKKFGLNSSNTYLFVRGHNIYDFVVQLGRLCTRELREIKKAELGFDDERIDKLFSTLPNYEKALLDSLHTNGYSQMDKIGRDIKRFYTETIH